MNPLPGLKGPHYYRDRLIIRLENLYSNFAIRLRQHAPPLAIIFGSHNSLWAGKLPLSVRNLVRHPRPDEWGQKPEIGVGWLFNTLPVHMCCVLFKFYTSVRLSESMYVNYMSGGCLRWICYGNNCTGVFVPFRAEIDLFVFLFSFYNHQIRLRDCETFTCWNSMFFHI